MIREGAHKVGLKMCVVTILNLTQKKGS